LLALSRVAVGIIVAGIIGGIASLLGMRRHDG
jgi:hypothetical protein